MRIKVQTTIDGVVRELFINPASKDLVAIQFNEAELNMLAQWPSAKYPLVTGPKGFIQANPKVMEKFVSEWPVEFHSTHTLPNGGVLGPDGRLLDKKI